MPRELTLRNPDFPTIVPSGDTLLVGSNGTEEAPCDGKFSVDALGEALGVFRLIAGETTIADGLGVPDYEGSPLVADATFGGVLPTTDDLYDPVIWFLWVPESAEMIGLHRNKSSNIIDMIRGYGGTTAEWIAPESTIYLLRAAQIPTIADLNAWGGDTSALEAMIESGLLGKSDIDHGHAIADVTGLQTALDGKSATGHTHTIANVTGLQTELDGKSATGHGHAIADVTGLQTALDGKSATGHGHAIADVTGLQTALDGKSGTGHNHDSAYASATHSHGQDQVTGLVDDLAAIDDELAALGDSALDHEARLDDLEAAEGGGGVTQTGMPVIAGHGYRHIGDMVIPTTGGEDVLFVSGYGCFYPLTAAVTGDITNLAIQCGTATGEGTLYLGIYENDGSATPGALIGGGSVAWASGSLVHVSGLDVPIVAGQRYWFFALCVTSSGAPEYYGRPTSMPFATAIAHPSNAASMSEGVAITSLSGLPDNGGGAFVGAYPIPRAFYFTAA